MKQTKHISPYRLLPFALLVLTVFLVTLNYVFQQQIELITKTEQEKSQLQSQNVAKAIDSHIKDQRRIMLTFALDHKALLEKLVSDPENNTTVEYYRTLLKTYLPSLFAFSLYNPAQHSLLLQDPEFNGKIDQLCLQDTESFARQHPQHLRIHPNPIRYHYDIYNRIQINQRNFILFTSFRVDPLVQILKRHKLPGHMLFLVRKTPEGMLIELSSEGDRKTLLQTHQRDSAFFTPLELKNIQGHTTIPCSEWIVIDIVDPDYIETIRTKLQQRSKLLLYLAIGVTALFLLFLWLYSRKEQRFIEEIQTLNQQLKQQAEQDGLTGLANRRMFDEALTLTWANAQRYGTPVSLIMVDLDYFKQLNDTLGHQAGDQALKKVAQVLKQHLKRKTDLAARYGGEELAILLPGTTLKDACVLAEKIRQAIEALKLPNPKAPGRHILTASLGVAGWIPEKNQPERTLVHCADKHLYEAKTQGRNRCICSDQYPC